MIFCGSLQPQAVSHIRQTGRLPPRGAPIRFVLSGVSVHGLLDANRRTKRTHHSRTDYFAFDLPRPGAPPPLEGTLFTATSYHLPCLYIHTSQYHRIRGRTPSFNDPPMCLTGTPVGVDRVNTQFPRNRLPIEVLTRSLQLFVTLSFVTLYMVLIVLVIMVIIRDSRPQSNIYACQRFDHPEYHSYSQASTYQV